MDTNDIVANMSSNSTTQFLHPKYLICFLFTDCWAHTINYLLSFLLIFLFNLLWLWDVDWGWQACVATPHDKHDNLNFSNFTIIISVIDIYDSKSGKINL